ncbi:WcaG Nucleoside-diphosphate-sugar epimerases [Burkholderiaceae bacterium]
MKCLILGGAGFIGSNLLQTLIRRGHEVRIFTRNAISQVGLNELQPHFEEVVGNFLCEKDLRSALSNVEIVIHLISTKSPSQSNVDPEIDAEENIVGTLRMLKIAKEMGVKKIVFSSSGGTVYGQPISLPISEEHPTDPICSYGVSKLAIEKYLHLASNKYQLQYSVLRVSNVYGAGQSAKKGIGAASIFLWKIMNDQEITIWGDGEVSRDYIYISDVVDAFVCAIEKNTPKNIFNIGYGDSITINQLVELIGKITNKTPKVKYLSPRNFDVSKNYLNIELAKKYLNWKPRVDIRDGLNRMFIEYTDQFNDKSPN